MEAFKYPNIYEPENLVQYKKEYIFIEDKMVFEVGVGKAGLWVIKDDY